MQFEIIDVMRDMGLLDNKCRAKRVAWSAGADLARQYRFEHGCAPSQQLRPKTFGAGTHLKSLYAPSWRPRAVEAIRLAGSRYDEQSL